MKKLIFISALIYPLLSICQPVTISGKIINEEGQPIQGASITIKHTSKTIISDEDGQFTFLGSQLTDTLVVSAIGYETIEEPNNQKDLMTIVLKHSLKTLGEVIVNTGYQELPLERSTGSFEKIGTEIFNRRVSTDWLSRLEGISSVYFDKRGIGSGGITIRGRSTIYANANPLIVVDNFPYDGDINNINPNDIESITILKDAAAASIWGVQAGNGVIVITTKKGKLNKEPIFEFNINTTIGNKPDLYYAPAMSSSDFIDVETFLFGKGFYDGDISNTTTWPPLSPVVEILEKRRSGQISSADSATAIDAFRNIDSRSDLSKYFYQKSSTQQYALNYSGGSKNVDYYFSAGYDAVSSYLVRNNNHRLTLSSRTNYTPSEFFRFTADLSYTGAWSQYNNSGQNINVGNSKSLYPYAQLADQQGNPLVIIKDHRYSFVDTAGNGKLLDWKYRPLQELNEANNKTNQTDLLLNARASFIFSQHFNADILYQVEDQSNQIRNLYSQNTYFTRNLINRYYNPATSKYAVPLGSILDLAQSSLLSQAGRVQFNYKQSWNSLHEVSAIAGAECKQANTSSNNYRTYGYSDDVLTYTNVNFIDNLPIYDGIASSQPIPNPQGFAEGVHRLVSLYGNAAYTYLRKYTATISVRKDASNLFGVASNQKWVPLWSSGLSWQIDKEKFYHADWLPFLKLRITYGYNGNVDNTLSALTTIRYSSNALFTLQPFASVNNPPNPELRWEKISIFDMGIDFASLHDRITGSIDYYIKNGNDLIGFSPVDPTTGVLSNTLTFSFKGNVAAMKGNGVDVILNSQNLTGKFKWATSFLFNYAFTKVTKYNVTNFNAATYLNYGTAISPLPGKPLYSIFSYQWAGLDPATGDPQGYLNGVVSKDYTALTNVTVDKLVYNGSAVPVFFGSLLNTFSWNKISLSVNIIYKLKYYFRRTSIDYTALFTNWNTHSDFTKRWQKPGDELLTNVPSMIYPNSNVNRDFFYDESQVLVEKGDHVRMQDVSLSYTIDKFKNKWLIKYIQPYIYINNIGIIWKANKAGLDPDYFSGGFPLPRTFSFGCKLNF